MAKKRQYCDFTRSEMRKIAIEFANQCGGYVDGQSQAKKYNTSKDTIYAIRQATIRLCMVEKNIACKMREISAEHAKRHGGKTAAEISRARYARSLKKRVIYLPFKKEIKQWFKVMVDNAYTVQGLCQKEGIIKEVITTMVIPLAIEDPRLSSDKLVLSYIRQYLSRHESIREFTLSEIAIMLKRREDTIKMRKQRKKENA